MRDKICDAVNSANSTHKNVMNQLRSQLSHYLQHRAFPDSTESTEFKVSFKSLDYLLRLALRVDSELSVPPDALDQISKVRAEFDKVRDASKNRAAAVDAMFKKQYWVVLYYLNHGFTISRIKVNALTNSTGRVEIITEPVYYHSLERFAELQPEMHSEFMVSHVMAQSMRPNIQHISGNPTMNTYCRVGYVDDIGVTIPHGDYGSHEPMYQAGYYETIVDCRPQSYMVEVL
jgi:hypothetical protein